MKGYFERWREATAGWRAEIAGKIATADLEERALEGKRFAAAHGIAPARPAAPTRPAASGLGLGLGPGGRSGELLGKLLEDLVRRMSPRAKAEMASAVEQWEAKLRARDREHAGMRSLAPRGDWAKDYAPARKMVESSHMELKADDDQVFVFYPATWDGPDLQGDVIVRGAFKKGIPQFLRGGWISSNHANDAEPIGRPILAQEDGRGLRVTARWHQTPKGQAWRQIARERLAGGQDMPASIGYTVDPGGYSYERMGGQQVRLLTSIQLYEAAVCNLGANPAAGFVSA